MMKKILPCILVSVAAAASLPAMATSSSYHTAYNKGSSCGSGSTPTSPTTDCPTFKMTTSGTTSANGVNVSADAYYNTAGSTTLNSAYSMTYYSGSGYGISSTSSDGGSPQHAVDNSGAYEWIMLSFDKAVSLDEITLGWISGDADMTILASGGGSTNLSAWNWVENVYYGTSSTPGQFSTDSSGRLVASLTNEICASHWLIGALNPAYNTMGSNYVGNDYFKLYSVAACTDCTPPGQPNTGVPEPGSLALAGLGLLGVLGMRRRRV